MSAMTIPKIGAKAPDITLPSDGGGTVSLKDYKGQKVLVYFYPKDDTPGCTAESCSLSENLSKLNKLNCAVIGISKNSVKDHDKFKKKFNLKFPLASDEEGDVCERYGVWAEKSMMGRKYMGILRTTFLIDEEGKIEQVWENVKVDGHTDEILEALKESKKAA
jgi:thioredoxin-dependent peroxiredoxin